MFQLMKIQFLFLLIFTISCSDNSMQPLNENSKVEILYIAEIFDPEYRLSLVIIDSEGKNRKEIISVNFNFLGFPSFSKDGDDILFVMESDTIDNAYSLYSINIVSGNLTKLSKTYINENNFQFYYPQLLPSTDKLIYMTKTAENKNQIRLLTLFTQEDTVLVEGDFNNIPPDIDKDGNWVIYWEEANLYKININNLNRIKITNDNCYAERFSINKSSNRILFRLYNYQEPTDWKIAGIDLDGSDFKIFPMEGQFPRYSPDGNYILYQAGSANGPAIWITDSDGNDPRIVTSNTSWDYYPQFFPDRDKILFAWYNVKYALYSCNIDGTNLTKITEDEFYADWHYPLFRP